MRRWNSEKVITSCKPDWEEYIKKTGNKKWKQFGEGDVTPETTCKILTSLN